ncbi:MAG TPA: hypothetical protein VFE06_18115, partial [Acidobacteriaceae bacterium]|nr:hypothetical protein [Acidobacteriaceae bacterium]
MPTKPGKPEQALIRLFVSAYEDFAWVGSKVDALDERTDGTIDALITRPDGQTMAIEHTLIEPFVGEKRDYAMFENAFVRVQNDTSLVVPDTGIRVFVPVGLFEGQRKPARRDNIVESVHSWIANNRLKLREGKHQYQCDVPGMAPITITVERHKFGRARPNPGSLLVGRQQVSNDLDEVIERALQKKLPKLANTKADRHVLFLERDRFSFFPDLIFTEIERQRPNFPLLENVDEIWHVETIFYGQGYVDFELWKEGKVLETIALQNGEPVSRTR